MRAISTAKDAYLAAQLMKRYALERAEFKYLPPLDLMVQGGYLELKVGRYYQTDRSCLISHGIQILSQSSMTLLYQNEIFITGRLVTSDEKLIRFLAEYRFPLPI
jgi:hypothetical protein